MRPGIADGRDDRIDLAQHTLSPREEVSPCQTSQNSLLPHLLPTVLPRTVPLASRHMLACCAVEVQLRLAHNSRTAKKPVKALISRRNVPVQ